MILNSHAEILSCRAVCCALQASMPKQYLDLLGKPIAMHSLHTFGSMPEVGEIVVVCDPAYRCILYVAIFNRPKNLLFPKLWKCLQRPVSTVSGSAAGDHSAQLCCPRHRAAGQCA